MNKKEILCAVAHVSPVFLNLNETIDKASTIINEAAGNNASLIAFPEAFIPGFPYWSAISMPIANHDLFLKLYENSISIDSEYINQLKKLAKQNKIIISIGFNEKTHLSNGTLWNSNILIDDRGIIISHHRKLVPTFYEKLTWANGDGAGLIVKDTTIGKIGMLICGENTNSLAKFSLIAQGEQIHISSYPAKWPTQISKDGQYNLEQSIKIRAGSHAFEGKLFNLVAAGFMDHNTYKVLEDYGCDAKSIFKDTPAAISAVFNPEGNIQGDFLCETEGILYTSINLDDCIRAKQFHDISGGYNRFDIFQLKVDHRRTSSMQSMSGEKNE
jgi:nitrilase